MRLLQANKILLSSLVVALPVSFYFGLQMKQRYLAEEFERADARDARMMGAAARARVAELQQERAELERERGDVQSKIVDIQRRIAAGESA